MLWYQNDCNYYSYGMAELDIWIHLYSNDKGTTVEMKEFSGADVSEVKRGAWLWDRKGCYCSVCRYRIRGDLISILGDADLYCPKCGAKMRM